MGIQECSEEPSIRHFYDPKNKDCFPFKYSGCGGNDNNHLTRSECMECAPIDEWFTCAGGAHPRGRCREENDCPPDSTCVGAEDEEEGKKGLCCDDDATAQAEDRDCGSKTIVKVEGYDYLGKSCKHKFCPDDSECRENAYFAFCCK
ncbi:Kunitz/Bovine pancreatic trypsin inhibitor domain protein [Trichostrongylus colubriformis]|uniref:Kunitz/Bovine pancreatic trypsin inhibitor domain protein n=1 Tax=Trichostrongylus colubriformis TaxID=6319 RepID=A0AAN8FRI2_TRICO